MSSDECRLTNMQLLPHSHELPASVWEAQRYFWAKRVPPFCLYCLRTRMPRMRSGPEHRATLHRQGPIWDRWRGHECCCVYSHDRSCSFERPRGLAGLYECRRVCGHFRRCSSGRRSRGHSRMAVVGSQYPNAALNWQFSAQKFTITRS